VKRRGAGEWGAKAQRHAAPAAFPAMRRVGSPGISGKHARLAAKAACRKRSVSPFEQTGDKPLGNGMGKKGGDVQDGSIAAIKVRTRRTTTAACCCRLAPASACRANAEKTG